MPFLRELQTKYENDLVVIGVTNEDKWGNTLENVMKFVENKKSIINFRIAWLDPSKPDDNLHGIFLHEWMRNIGTQNLPMAFVIAKDGKIAYIGETLTVEKPVEELINDTYHFDLAKKMYSNNLKASLDYDKIKDILESENYEKSYKIAQSLIENSGITKARIFSVIADKISNNTKISQKKWIDLGLQSAKKAVMLSDFGNGGYLDALAGPYSKNGDILQAIKTQKLAISMIDGEMKEAQEKNLESYFLMLE